MTTKELKSILSKNRNVVITLGYDWKLSRNLDSLGGSNVYVNNIYNVDKDMIFENTDEGVKFFMSKVSYTKSFFKRKGMSVDDIEIKIEI